RSNDQVSARRRREPQATLRTRLKRRQQLARIEIMELHGCLLFNRASRRPTKINGWKKEIVPGVVDERDPSTLGIEEERAEGPRSRPFMNDPPGLNDIKESRVRQPIDPSGVFGMRGPQELCKPGRKKGHEPRCRFPEPRHELIRTAMSGGLIERGHQPSCL